MADVLRFGRPDMSPGIDTGLLEGVIEGEGTGLVGPHAAGATTLNVAAGGFRTAGTCRVDGVTYTYVRDQDTLQISPALAAAADDGEPVESLTPAGMVETSLVALVDLDMDGDSEADVRAVISGDLAGFYPLGQAAAGALVRVRDTAYGYEIASRPLDAPAMDAAVLDPATLEPAGITPLQAHLDAVAAIEASLDANSDLSLAAQAAADAAAADAATAILAIEGPLIETSTLPSVGVKFNSGGIIGYGGGSAKFTLDTNGNLILVGALLTGGTITGPVFQTTATAQRGIKISGAGLIGYDGSGVAKTIIYPETGLISAVGSLQAGDGSDVWVRMITSGTTGLLEFFAGGVTTPGKMTGGYNGALPMVEITSPTNGSYFTPGKILVASAAGFGVVNIGNPGDSLNIAGAVQFSNGSGTHAQIEGNGKIHGLRLISTGWDTTGTAANTFMNSQGELAKSTSSRRYKTGISTDLFGLTVPDLLALEPKSFRHIEDASGEDLHIGFIAEEAEALGLSTFVTYDDVGRPDGFQYAAWTAALQAIARDHAAQIADLTTRTQALEGA